MQSKFYQTKLICCIRTEIVSAINKYIPTYEINKITNGFEYPLLWNYNNNINHPIFQILLKRIEYTELKKNNIRLTDNETYEKWFEQVIYDNNSTIHVFLNHTWNKPRDVVRFLLAVQNSQSSKSEKFNQQTFVDSMEEYSRKSLEELKEELNASYTKQEIDEIFTWLNGFRTIFTVNELEERINNYFSISLLKNNIQDVLKSLYRVGVIGNYSKITQNFLWKHRGNDDPVFDEEWLFYIHRGLFKALNVNTTTNYKKQLFANKREVQIGEVFEVTIQKILSQFIKVSFHDGYGHHKGVIHISELENKYITEEYLLLHYSEGDTFLAKIISFNNKHQNWCFSKKQADNFI